MANEVKMTTKITFDKGSVAGVKRDETDKSFDVTGARYSQGVQNVGFASTEAINFGDVGDANAGFCHMKNLDATNFVKIGGATGEVYVMKLKPGESCLFRWMKAAGTGFIQADTAACDVEILTIED